METTIDRAGRIVIPAAVRKALGLEPGTKLEVVVRDFSVQLYRVAEGPELVRCGKRWVARPTASPEPRTPVDIARLVEEERDRWP